MSEAEVVAWLARPAAGNICGYFRAEQFAPPLAPAPPRWRRWLVAAVALLGLKPLLVTQEAAAFSLLRPVPRTVKTEQADNQAAAPKGQVTIRGRVLDDSTGLGVPNGEIFIGDTKYGATTDEQGNFSFTMPRRWRPVREGRVVLHVQAGHFTFEKLTMTVQLSLAPAPLVLRLQSLPIRGHNVMGKPIPRHDPPQKPPQK